MPNGSSIKSWILETTDKTAKGRIFGERIRYTKVSIVQDVLCFYPKLNFHSLIDPCRLKQRKINAVEIISEERISTYISKGRFEVLKAFKVAEAAAKLISLQGVSRMGEEIARIQHIVAQELERIAMP